jgi:thermostable 8-oxoguanine DNA glycosylase
MKTKEAIDFFIRAYSEVVERGYLEEIMWCRNRRFSDITPLDFLDQYMFAVFSSSGLNNQVVQKQMDKFTKAVHDGENAFDTIKNRRMKDAIVRMWTAYPHIFEILKSKKTDFDKIEYLETLQQIGPKEKLHLARNLGIDCVKPDRHMLKLAEKFEYATPDEMCRDIQRNLPIPERIGVIDVILWRYCNLIGGI